MEKKDMENNFRGKRHGKFLKLHGKFLIIFGAANRSFVVFRLPAKCDFRLYFFCVALIFSFLLFFLSSFLSFFLSFPFFLSSFFPSFLLSFLRSIHPSRQPATKTTVFSADLESWSSMHPDSYDITQKMNVLRFFLIWPRFLPFKAIPPL